MPLPELSLLASSLPDPASSESTGWLFVAIGGLALTCNQVLSAIVGFKKLRGEEPTDGRYASKDDHDGLTHRVTGLEVQMSTLNNTVAHELRAMNRSLGRLEGAAGTVER